MYCHHFSFNIDMLGNKFDHVLLYNLYCLLIYTNLYGNIS